MGDERRIDLKESVAGVVSSGDSASIDRVKVTIGQIQHAEAPAIAESLENLKMALAQSKLPSYEKRSAGAELEGLVEELAKPATPERDEGIGYHIERLRELARSSEGLISAVNSLAQLVLSVV